MAFLSKTAWNTLENVFFLLSIFTQRRIQNLVEHLWKGFVWKWLTAEGRKLFSQKAPSYMFEWVLNTPLSRISIEYRNIRKTAYIFFYPVHIWTNNDQIKCCILKSESHVPGNFCQVKMFPSLVWKNTLICLLGV